MDSMALRQTASSSTSYYSAACSKESRVLPGSVNIRRRRPMFEQFSSGFCDLRHLQYFNGSDFRPSSSAGRITVMSGKQEKKDNEKPLKKMKKKKQLKLLKGLTRDLSTFCQIGFGLDGDGALLDQVKGSLISESAQVLLEQLQKMRAEEEQHKRRIKEEKARVKAAAVMQKSFDCEINSSSESSGGESGERADSNLVGLQVVEEAPAKCPTTVIPSIGVQLGSSDSTMDNSVETGPRSSCSKKIEVCMGGKCRKSGGGALLEEFRRAVGIDGAVSGCKCMGKCRDGPNVKVVSEEEADIGATLCKGVGLEDVNMIVSSFLGENQNQFGFASAS